jgi:hypothetical protein
LVLPSFKALGGEILRRCLIESNPDRSCRRDARARSWTASIRRHLDGHRRRASPIAPHGAVGAALLTLRENPSVRRPFLNTFGSPIIATTAVALIGPMPGMPRRRRQASLSAEASSIACSHGSERTQGLLVAGQDMVCPYSPAIGSGEVGSYSSGFTLRPRERLIL